MSDHPTYSPPSTGDRDYLLNDHSQDARGEENLLPSSAHFKRAIKILTTITLTCSLLFLIHLLATYLVILNSQLATFSWRPWDRIGASGLLACITLILAVLNLNIWIPIGINAPIDFFLAKFILQIAPSIQWYIPQPASCDRDPTYEYGMGYGVAKRWVSSIMVLGGFVGTAVGICHLLLFVLRVVATFRAKFWRRPIPLRIPGGQVSFEFKVKHEKFGRVE